MGHSIMMQLSAQCTSKIPKSGIISKSWTHLGTSGLGTHNQLFVFRIAERLSSFFFGGYFVDVLFILYPLEYFIAGCLNDE